MEQHGFICNHGKHKQFGSASERQNQPVRRPGPVYWPGAGAWPVGRAGRARLHQEIQLRTIVYLHVEDNEDLRDTIGALVERPDREWVAVGSAERALACLENRHFDILVTDLNLPGMSGAELVRRWQAGGPDRWTVLCSGFDIADQAKAFGPRTRVWPKSSDIEVFEALLDEMESALRAGDDDADRR